MIAPDSVHALNGIIALQKNPVPPVFASATSEQRSEVFAFDYQTYILELSDTSAIIRPFSQREREEESLRRLYAEFANEDLAFAEDGLRDFRNMLQEFSGE